ncbi:hypothetical protein [Solidesulfovibrio magneticus]|uniref:Uncharacterized protein n=1 Tax=Solidesulfovibrio magneticus (strain ATCC 700980 / DSM 13731 / RS-1) TaxID=573370 RepID=C4XU68_SOLM1|nr:hypothetical protein [Solidesulfovibrio magneticus]BAH76090.1 hypothetical protein DMR_25990 [Solidesulfovibrio magneticus RS-1]
MSLIQTKSSKEDFGSIISDFISNIESLHRTLYIVMSFIKHVRKNTNDEFEEFLSKNAKSTKKSETETEYSIEFTSYYEFKQKLRDVEWVNRSGTIIPKSFVVSLISEYDAYLGMIIRRMYRIKPEVLNSKDNQISFSDIVTYDSLDQIKEIIIDKEVENLLRNSHPEQFKIIEATFSVILTKEVEGWNDFVELTERRNLFVHCNGIVSKQYLDTCKKHKIEINDLKKGDPLQVSPDYFDNAFNTVLTIGFMIGHVLWRKFQPEESQDADKHLISVVYSLLTSKHYSATITLCKFAIKCIGKKFSSEETRRIIVINYAIALKFSSKKEEMEKLLNENDWSASSEKFKLAVLVLNDNNTEAATTMRKIGCNGEVTKADYNNWPLFENFRETEIFKTTYLEVFNEESMSISEDIKNEQENSKTNCREAHSAPTTTNKPKRHHKRSAKKHKKR